MKYRKLKNGKYKIVDMNIITYEEVVMKYFNQNVSMETILKENARLKDKFKDLEEWLEAMASMYENEYKDVNASEHYKCMLHKLKEN